MLNYRCVHSSNSHLFSTSDDLNIKTNGIHLKIAMNLIFMWKINQGKPKKKYVCLFLMHKTKLPGKTLFIVSIYHNPEGALISHAKESKME